MIQLQNPVVAAEEEHGLQESLSNHPLRLILPVVAAVVREPPVFVRLLPDRARSSEESRRLMMECLKRE